jgi:hypothetical protein
VSARRPSASRLLLLVAALAIAVAVGVAVAASLPPGDRTATGLVTDIRDRSLTEVDRFTLRASDGQVAEYHVGRLTLDATSFPAGHLREHQLLNQPVLVTYREEGGERVAVRLQDAPVDGGAPSAHPISSGSS